MTVALAFLRLAAMPVADALVVDAAPDGVVEVAWRGCRAELRGPRCVTAPGDGLVLWTRFHVAATGAPATCDAGSPLLLAGRGHTIVAAGSDDDGCWTRLTVDDPTGALELRGRGGRILWALPFAGDPPQDPVVERANRRFTVGDDAEARRLLGDAMTRLRAIDPTSLALARALDLDRRIALRSDDFAAGLASADAARDLYQALGWTSAACDITYALVNHHWVAERDAEAAWAVLHAAAPCVADIPRYAFHHRLARAMLIEGLGDPIETSSAYQGIDVLVRRLRDLDSEAAILAEQHFSAEQMRRHEDAQRIERRIDTLMDELTDSPSCGLTNALSNLSWSVLMRRERGESTRDPRRVITTVRERYRVGPCRSADDHRNATINLALAELQLGEPARAEALLVRFGPAPRDPEGELWRHLILVRAGLSRGNFKLASSHATRLEALAVHHADPYFGWHAALARGDLHAAHGRLDAAIAAYQAAESLRDEMALPMALGAGRERVGVRWDISAMRLIALQIAQGHPEAAVRTARLARRRSLRAVAAIAVITGPERLVLADEVRRHRDDTDESARDDALRTGIQLKRALAERRTQRFELRRKIDAATVDRPWPSTALREPAAGELLLVYYPLEAGWVGFADDGERVVVSTFELPAEPSDDELGRALYEPFVDEISDAEVLRIIATGDLLARDLHGLPHRGEPLLAHATVAYAFDLTEAPAGPLPPLTRGLVVAANPGGDVPRLQFVERELVDVVGGWLRLGLVPTPLVGKTAVRDIVLEQLPRADIFHFIGHHRLRPGAVHSADAWEYELLLEEGTSLTVEDVVMLADRVPRVVVLSACQTGMTDREATSGGVAIGHSFLLRGAALAVATARPVDDAVAARVAKAFYLAATDAAMLADPATLTEAQRDLLGDDACSDHPDVCAYRAWVP